MHRYKLVIFDWDGTLMDSVDRIVFSMQASAVALSFEPPSYHQAKQIIGLYCLSHDRWWLSSDVYLIPL